MNRFMANLLALFSACFEPFRMAPYRFQSLKENSKKKKNERVFSAKVKTSKGVKNKINRHEQHK